jgi:hypothetical protein
LLKNVPVKDVKKFCPEIQVGLLSEQSSSLTYSEILVSIAPGARAIQRAALIAEGERACPNCIYQGEGSRIEKWGSCEIEVSLVGLWNSRYDVYPSVGAVIFASGEQDVSCGTTALLVHLCRQA